MGNKLLLIGCGGSGLKTLMHFNEVLASSEDGRGTLFSDIAYLAVDTEGLMLEAFESTVLDQMRGATPPVMGREHLSKDFVSLDEVVIPNFGQSADETNPRLKPHWWFSPNQGADGDGCASRPFCAHSIRPLCAGSGMCAAVSYLLTWQALPRFRGILDDMLNKMLRRNIAEEVPLRSLRVCIVAGLAGGTGRGSWALVALAVRQYFARRGIQVVPEGVFFDATCFPNVESCPEAALSLRLNSLTGWSELSAWMRLGWRNPDFSYSLPDMRTPEQDVIKEGRDFCSGWQMPLSRASIICGHNGNRVLPNNDCSHEMAATGIYAKYFSGLEPSLIIHPECFNSFVATTLSVDTDGLRFYFETMVRKSVLGRILSKPIGKDLLAQDVVMRSGLMDLVLPAPVSAQTLVVSNRGHNSVLSEIVAIVSEMIGCDENGTPGSFRAFAEELLSCRRIDAKDLGARMHQALVLEDFDPRCGQRVEAFFADRGLSDTKIAEKVRQIVFAVLAAEGEYVSVGCACATIEQLIVRLEESKANIFGCLVEGREAGVLDAWTKKIICSLEDAADAYVQGPFRDLIAKRGIGLLARFSFARQVYELKDLYGVYMRYSIFFRIQPVLLRKIDIALLSLKQISAALAVVAAGFKDADERLSSMLCRRFHVGREKEAHRMLFTDATGEAMISDLPVSDGCSLPVKRILKPIMRQADVAALLLQEGTCAVYERGLANATCDEINRQFSSKESASVDGWTRTALCAVLQNVRLSRDFMDRNFSLMQVLRRNVPHWNGLIRDCWGSAQEFSLLRDGMKASFGVELSAESDTVPSISGEELVEGSVREMIRYHPMVLQKKPAASCRLRRMVFLPFGVGESQLHELSMRFPGEDIRWEYGAGEHGCLVQNDRIIVFSYVVFDRFDSVGSFDYWQDPVLKDRLLQAEGNGGVGGYFEKVGRGDTARIVERSRPFGYTSPIFVQNERFSALRWKPWCE